MYKIQVKQGETIHFESLLKNEEEIKELLKTFELEIKNAYEERLSSLTITNSLGLPCILPRNIIMNSIISIIKE